MHVLVHEKTSSSYLKIRQHKNAKNATDWWICIHNSQSANCLIFFPAAAQSMGFQKRIQLLQYYIGLSAVTLAKSRVWDEAKFLVEGGKIARVVGP
jgi:hypothetical protein